MTPDQINKSIAELLGWTDVNFYEDNAGPGYWNGYPPSKLGVNKNGEWVVVKESYHKHLPNYFGDLNACVEFEDSLTEKEKHYYESILIRVLGQRVPGDDRVELSDFDLLSAKAPKRCEAFLRLKDEWK